MNAWWLLLIGLALLTAGAEGLVRGGASLALRLGLTPLVIGLTIMAYGTSSPEIVITVQAAAAGTPGLAVGNVIGSNLCNIAFIAGLCALFRPLEANAGVRRREVPLLVVGTLLAAALLLDGHLGRVDGVVLLTGLLAYSFYAVKASRREAAEAAAAAAERPRDRPWPLAVTLVLFGLGGLLWGADLFVDGAVQVASKWGLSETVIGLTVVAIGTSLPELAISLVASLRGESDVALGNVVGSSLFNALGILGLAGVIQPAPLPDLDPWNLAIMVGVTLALLPLVRSGGRLSRREGLVLIAAYAGYLTWTVTQAT